MEPLVVAVLVGIVVYFVVVALIPKHILAESTEYTRNMLQQLEREASGLMASEDETISIMRENAQKQSLLARIFFTLPGTGLVYPRLVKAGLSENISTFFTVFLIILLLLVYCLRGGGMWGILAAFAITYMLAWYYIARRIAKRNEAFLNGFPDALDMIVRSVRSGYPLNAAVRMVAENMQPPISLEFKQVADETAYGSSLIESLQRLSRRIDEPDIRFFVVVLAVQQEVGGNLAEVLHNLASIIRKRKHLRMKVKALTSEGRASAWVLGLLPLFVFVLIYFVAPTHLIPFFTTTLGNILLMTAIGIVLLGAFIVRKLVSIQV